MHIVEFFGPPGSGKTYTATILRNKLQERDIPVDAGFIEYAGKNRFSRILLKSYFALYFSITACGISCSIIKACLDARDMKLTRKALILFNGLYLGGFLRSRKNSSVCILMDQGLFQWYFLIHKDEEDCRLLKQIFNFLKIKHYQVFNVNASKDIRESRLQDRYKEDAVHGSDDIVDLSMRWDDAQAHFFLNMAKRDMPEIVTIQDLKRDVEASMDAIITSLVILK